MMSRWLTILTFVFFGLLDVACAERGATSLEQTATSYVAAARRGDVSAIVALTPADFDAEEAARAKVVTYASARDLELEFQYRLNEMLPTIVVVDYVAKDGGFRDSVPIQRLGRRWYVTIGHSKTPPLPVPTARSNP